MFRRALRLRIRPAQVTLRSEPLYDSGDDVRNARGDSGIAVVGRRCEGGRGNGKQQQGKENSSLRNYSSRCFAGLFAYGFGQLRSPCGASPFTILAMTREMREAIPGSRSSADAAKAGVERATSSKATEMVLFDMISSN